MEIEKLINYISARVSDGISKEEITKSLLLSGWSEADIEKAFLNLDSTQKVGRVEEKVGANISSQTEKIKGVSLFGFVALTVVIILLSGVLYLGFEKQVKLERSDAEKIKDLHNMLVMSQTSFTDADRVIFPDEHRFNEQKNEYIANEDSFLEADLRTMRMVLWENGTPKKEINILTKGREGSWWETPTGNYNILGKELKHFSSTGLVWMPYSMQFYGNYFIHGWPYYDDGTPVSSTYSGGCIRLSIEDAKIVYEFAEKGMPVLILENKDLEVFGLLSPKETMSPPPIINAKSFMVADLSSSKIILEKDADEKISVNSITKLTTALVAHEIIYLGRSVKVTPKVLASVLNVFEPAVGETYDGFDLLYPLLMQSSDSAAKILSSFLGENIFVRNMNAKASSLAMKNTKFYDPMGKSLENVSSARDTTKLLQYIYFNRRFLFEISRGEKFDSVGLIKIGETIDIKNLKNLNEFIDDQNLIGVKDGKVPLLGEMIATVWHINTPDGNVPVGIVVLGSADAGTDTKKILQWLQENYITTQDPL